MKKRVYFEKLLEMKYISHLDLVRFLERLFKISEVKLEYTKGFHPRPKMSFGNPISIGEEAYSEPFDVELAEELDDETIMNRLNSKAPRGFKVIKVETPITKGSIVKDFNGIEYEMIFEKVEEKEKFEKLLNQEEIIEEKEKKGKIKRRNLKEKLVSYTFNEVGVDLILDNISPNAYLRMANIDDVSNIVIKRLRYLNI